ncbi:helix-turn-helix transcriptional regulator [Kocuria rhizophila]|nr:helix-turn-helix transcriptional regulator [Kocuria rhizophila]
MNGQHSEQGIATEVRRARRSREWSQSELADRAGVSRPTIARIEGGQDVSMATLAKVAGTLGLRLAVVATA